MKERDVVHDLTHKPNYNENPLFQVYAESKSKESDNIPIPSQLMSCHILHQLGIFRRLIHFMRAFCVQYSSECWPRTTAKIFERRILFWAILIQRECWSLIQSSFTPKIDGILPARHLFIFPVCCNVAELWIKRLQWHFWF